MKKDNDCYCYESFLSTLIRKGIISIMAMNCFFTIIIKQ